MESSSPKIATAVPVVSPAAVRVEASPYQPTNSPLSAESERFGVCRRCRREFERPPGEFF